MSSENQKPTAEKSLEELVYRDDLTGLFNRRYFKEKFASISSGIRESGGNLSLLMVDIDHFKGINDTYGHHQGDKIIIKVAEAIRDATGEHGIPIRYAGDEFVALFPGATKGDSVSYAENMRQKVASQPFPVPDSDAVLTITLSIGVVNYPSDSEEPDKLFDLADECVYISKKKGRNAVSTIDERVPKTIDLSNLYQYFPCRTFVGRKNLLDAIRPFISPALAPNRPVVVLGGPDGIGKSRILREIYDSIDSQRCHALHSRSYPHLIGQSFVEIIGALSPLLAASRPLTEKIISGLKPYELAEITRFLPMLAAYLSEDASSLAVPPEKKKNVAVGAFAELLLALARERPLIVILDDFHWSNLGTRLVLEKVKGDERGKNCTIIVSLDRDESQKVLQDRAEEFLEKFSSATTLVQETLPPLSTEEVSLMVQSIIPGVSEHPKIIEVLAEKVKGNPRFLEESLKFLLHKEIIQFREGKLEISSFRPEDIPDSLGEVVKPQVEALDDEVRAVLSRAAVMGHSFDLETLKQLEQKNEGYLLDILEKAERASLIVREGEANTYRFQERQASETFYNLLRDDEKEKFHRQIALIEEQLNSDSLDGILSEIAFHYQNGKSPEEAARYLKQIVGGYGDFVSTPALGIYIGPVSALDEKWSGEKTLLPEEMDQAVQVMRILRTALHNIGRYPPESEIVQGTLYTLFLELNGLLEKAGIVTYSESEGGVLVNGKKAELSGARDTGGADLAGLLAASSLKGVSFRRGLTQDELQKFLELVTTMVPSRVSEPGAWKKLLAENGIEHAGVDEKIYVAFGSKDLAEARTIKKDSIFTTDSMDWQDAKRAPEAQEKASEASAASLPPGLESKLDELLKELSSLGNIEARIDKISGFLELVRTLRESAVKNGASPLIISSSSPETGGPESTGPGEEAIQKEKEKAREASALEKEEHQKLKELKSRLDLQILEKLERDPEVLVQELASQNPDEARAAAYALLDAGNEARRPLLRFLETSDSRSGRKMAFQVLKQIEPAVDRMLLDELMGPTSADEKVRLLEILSDVSRLDISGYVSVLLRNSRGKVRRAVLRLLEGRPSERIISLLIQHVSEVEGDSVMDVILSLGRLKIRQAVETLSEIIRKRMQHDKEIREDVQEAACLALGKIGDLSAIEALRDALQISPPFLFKRNKTSTIRSAAAYALGGFPPEETQAILELASRDRDPGVRSAANLALSEQKKLEPAEGTAEEKFLGNDDA
jgi:diguanylate cyclase (GGDEF)-like protein